MKSKASTTPRRPTRATAPAAERRADATPETTEPAPSGERPLPRLVASVGSDEVVRWYNILTEAERSVVNAWMVAERLGALAGYNDEPGVADMVYDLRTHVAVAMSSIRRAERSIIATQQHAQPETAAEKDGAS